MYDVIVVGAGPAGSTAAIALARAGRQVLLLDKANFPRDKPCGDMLHPFAIHTLRKLGVDMESREFHVLRRVVLFAPDGSPLEWDQTPGTVVPRRVLDHLLVQLALKEGVSLRRVRVQYPLITKGVVAGVVGCEDHRVTAFQAPIVIGADGSKSVIARTLRGGGWPTPYVFVAIRAYFRLADNAPATTAELYWNQDLAPGYGWLFPMGDGVANVGWGTRLDVLVNRRVNLRTAFAHFLERPPIRAMPPIRTRLVGPLGPYRAWTLNTCWLVPRRSYPGAVLIGDAGGFIDPLNGGGLHYALRTGLLAARVVNEALDGADTSLTSLGRFDALWRKEFAWQMRLANWIQRHITAHPSRVNLAFSPLKWSRLSVFGVYRIAFAIALRKQL